MKIWSFAKGHGTMNDFVVIVDRHNLVPITDAEVRFLCDRRRGIGGDGLLRVTRASSIPEWQGDPDLWFMDYRNGDGSMAEMCGNGLRVYARYLLDEDLATGLTMQIATRAGIRTAEALKDGRIRTSMGRVEVAEDELAVQLQSLGWPATKVSVGNPHAVVFLADDQYLGGLDLSVQPTWGPHDAFPDGANVEFVEVLSEDHVSMRVHERGVGETMSCGTGTVAVAAAHLRRLGRTSGSVWVDVPGGTLLAELDDQGQAHLTGPAVVLARGTVSVPDELS